MQVSGGQVSGDTGRVPIAAGTAVTLSVTSDVADEVHVHGYDLTAELPPGTPAEITFDATVTGVFEVELHEAGTVLLTLQVGREERLTPLAHGVGSRTDLPIPLGLALYGAGAAILISFAILLLFWRTPAARRRVVGSSAARRRPAGGRLPRVPARPAGGRARARRPRRRRGASPGPPDTSATWRRGRST